MAGEDEVFLKVSDENERITVVAVRDPGGNLIGYYERFEMPAEYSLHGTEPATSLNSSSRTCGEIVIR